jgi:hypothetical protein
MSRGSIAESLGKVNPSKSSHELEGGGSGNAAIDVAAGDAVGDLVGDFVGDDVGDGVGGPTQRFAQLTDLSAAQ